MQKVNEYSKEAKAMQPRLAVVDALSGGTWTMREARTAYLVQFPAETEESYDYRVKTSTLFNAFQRTVENMASKPFTEPLTWAEIEPTVEAWFDNIDLQGRDIHTFSHEAFTTGLRYGLTHVLVEYPKTVDADGKPIAPTLADERNLGLRPYLVHIKPSAVLGWVSEAVNGIETLTQVRLLESVTVPDGQFGTKKIEQVRVLTPGAWAIYREDERTKEWALFGEGTTSLTYIPLVTFYTNRTGFMTALPPLSDLADLNVQHWNSSSDQYSILHIARVPLLLRIGADLDNTGKVVAIGKGLIDVPQGGDMKYVEHTGAAIEAGRTSLKDLEEQMRTMGAELLVVKPGNMTATQSSIDTAQAQCQLARMASAYEDVLDQCIDIMAGMVGLKPQGDITMFKDFAANTMSDASAQVVLSAQQGGLISKETAVKELQRRGTLSADIDAEKEVAGAEAEGPSLGDM